MTKPTYTHKTASGLLARIICRDKLSDGHSVVALIAEDGVEFTMCLREDLTHETAPECNLTELPPYHDFAIDEPVMVRDGMRSAWRKENFSGVREGYATTWESGTKWSSLGHVMQWRECRRPTPEELRSDI